MGAIDFPGEPKRKTRSWRYRGRGGPYSSEPPGQPIVYVRTATSTFYHTSFIPAGRQPCRVEVGSLPGLGALKVHEAENSPNGLLSGVTVRSGKLGRESVLLASGEMGWVT